VKNVAYVPKIPGKVQEHLPRFRVGRTDLEIMIIDFIEMPQA
jgi:hypothetical protein